MLELLLLSLAYGELDLGDIDQRIDEYKITMQTLEKNLDIAKENLRIAKRDQHKSWEGSIHLESVQAALEEAENNVRESRIKYIDLLREKSNIIKDSKLADEQKRKDDEAQRIATRPNLSGLVKMIGVELSQSCIIQIKNKMPTDCPDYLDLRQLDSSKQEISGYFKRVDGYYFRDNPVLLESWRFYDHDPAIRVIIDPPNGMAERIRTITIQDNFDTYLLPDSSVMKQDYVILNNTSAYDGWGNNSTYTKLDKPSVQAWGDTASRVIYHDRFVDKYCKKAVINAEKWKMLLPDTIDYMRNNCDEKHTSFNHKEIVVQQLTPQDITTSQKWKDDQRIKWIKEYCIFKFKSC